jgi:DNA-binding MarR family transcriptional regulator
MARRPTPARAPADRIARARNETTKSDAAIDVTPLPDRIGYMLRRAQLAVFKDFARTCAEFDIRPAQYAVLVVIENNPGLKQIDVSTALGIKRTNLVALIDVLENRGLARREPVPSDRRSYALHLTAKGKSFMAKLHEQVNAHERHVTELLGEKNREQLLPLMRKLIDALGPAPGDEEI